MLEHREIIKKAIPILIQWYRKHRRDLPWRREVTPYRVWLSETMLQQTRIEAVIPYYERFLRELPTVEALAAVSDDKLMKLWEGLGYYSRARNLKKAAALLVSDYRGELPSKAEALRQLPGIGEYTAGAVASIAFGEPEPAVDGNVLRVFMRLTACKEDIAQLGTRRSVTKLLRELYPAGPEAGLLTEGIMELGEVICIPNGSPDCAACPLQSLCVAHQTDSTDFYPVKSPKKPRRVEERTVLLLSCDGRVAVRRREMGGLLGGMWEFPNFIGAATVSEVQAFLQSNGINSLDCKPCGEAKHIFTHVEWKMHGFQVMCLEPAPCYVWTTPETLQSEYAIPAAFRCFMKQLFR